MNDMSEREGVQAFGTAENAKPWSDPLLEPFPCPNCGQMLGPGCRVCVACRQPIDSAMVRQPAPVAVEKEQPEIRVRQAGKYQFSWAIFFAVLVGALVLVSLGVRLVGLNASRMAFIGLTFASAGWVFIDARSRVLPRPWRWSLLTLFFWLVFFPWYLSRRRTPQSPCPVIEAQTSIVFRALLWFVLLMLVLSFLALVMRPLH